jgi:hypothetical protein
MTPRDKVCWLNFHIIFQESIQSVMVPYYICVIILIFNVSRLCTQAI